MKEKWIRTAERTPDEKHERAVIIKIEIGEDVEKVTSFRREKKH